MPGHFLVAVLVLVNQTRVITMFAQDEASINYSISLVLMSVVDKLS